MQATRQRILEQLRLARGATVKDLCSLLGLTPTGVRQHLTILEQEGLVQSSELRGKVGRPAHRFTLTRRGETLFVSGYDRLANALIDEVREVFGGEGLQRVMRGVAGRLSGGHVAALESLTPEQRVQSVVELLEEDNVIADWERDGDSFLLHERTCPYPAIARRNSVSCALEVAEVRMLTGMDARLTSCIVRGDDHCTYRLRPIEDRASA
jgi:predicted ArsR family transcriptional regulator